MADDEATDAELLRRHASGDTDAFGLLFLRHRERLWAVAVRTLGGADEAGDALQDAMISAFRQAGSFRGDSAVTTWLYRIVVNACLDRLRRRAARPATTGLDETAMDVLAAGRHRAGADAETRAETAMEVTGALRTLPLEQRAALVLVDMLGYPVAEVAQVLGVSPGTVKSRCARGRARLLPQLAHLRGRAAADSPAASSATGPGEGATPRTAPARGPGDPPLSPSAVRAGPAPGAPGDAPARNRAATGRVSPGEGGER